jgi:List-Bact-rpt repeat protein
MIRKWVGTMLLAVIAVALLGVSSCARSQKLTSIDIQPGDGTFAKVDPSAYFTYKAYGSYIHPPQTLDITNQVSWQTDNSQVVQFKSAGVVSPHTNCGVAQIFATMHNSSNDVVSNQVSITVDGPASLGCPQSTFTYNLSVAITSLVGDGTIVSAPQGINCGTTCGFAFPAGSTVALTAAPNQGREFLGWTAGCTSVTGSGATCNVTMNSDSTVTASFN